MCVGFVRRGKAESVKRVIFGGVGASARGSVGILQETQLDRAGMIVTLFKCILKGLLIWLIE